MSTARASRRPPRARSSSRRRARGFGADDEAFDDKDDDQDDLGRSPRDGGVVPKDNPVRPAFGAADEDAGGTCADAEAGRLRMYGLLYEQIQTALGNVRVAYADGTEGEDVASYVGYIESDENGDFILDPDDTTTVQYWYTSVPSLLEVYGWEVDLLLTDFFALSHIGAAWLIPGR